MNLNQPVIEAIRSITVGDVTGMLIGWVIGALVVFGFFQWLEWRKR